MLWFDSAQIKHVVTLAHVIKFEMSISNKKNWSSALKKLGDGFSCIIALFRHVSAE